MPQIGRAAVYLLVLCCAALTACSSINPDAARFASLPPQAGAARLILVYPAPVMGSNGMAQVQVNDVTTCDLQSGGYVVRDVSPGETKLAVSFCGMRGNSYARLAVRTGQTYFIEVLPYDSSIRGMLSGYPGEFVSPGEKPHKGPFLVHQLSLADGYALLNTLSVSKNGMAGL